MLKGIKKQVKNIDKNHRKIEANFDSKIKVIYIGKRVLQHTVLV